MPSDEKDRRYTTGQKSRSRRKSSRRKTKGRAHRGRSSDLAKVGVELKRSSKGKQSNEGSRGSSPTVALPNLPPVNKDDELGIKPWVLTGRRSLLPPGLLSKYTAKTVSGTTDKDRLNNDAKRAGSWPQKIGSIDVEAGTGAAHAPLS